jgi:outer membrane protein TolC
MISPHVPQIPTGIPSTLLQRRPDIVIAQHGMEASNARIGVARAAMFPALNINGAIGGVGHLPGRCIQLEQPVVGAWCVDVDAHH